MDIDINIKQIHKQSFQNLQSSQLVLEFTGKTVNYCLINTLRRLCIDYIPTYSSCEKTIMIEKNTSVFDNDYMRLRLSQLTIPSIKIPIPYLEDKYWVNIDYSNPDREKHPKDKDIIDFYIKMTNTTETNMDVTTNHSQVVINGEVVEKFDKKYPLLLIQLKPKEEFYCQCTHVLGIGKVSNLWTGGNVYYTYDEKDEHFITMTLESQGQMDEYELLFKACFVLKQKIILIRDKLKGKTSPEGHLKIEFWDEDSTIGEVLNIFLQDHPQVSFSGICQPNLNIEMMALTYITSSKDPLAPIHTILDYITDIATFLQKKFDTIGSKYFL